MSPCHARAVQRVGAFINRLVHVHAFQQVEDKNKKIKSGAIKPQSWALTSRRVKKRLLKFETGKELIAVILEKRTLDLKFGSRFGQKLKVMDTLFF